MFDTLQRVRFMLDHAWSRTHPGHSLDFPPLDDADEVQWEWPAPPLDWAHLPGPSINSTQSCALTIRSGETIDGTLMRFDPVRGTILFRLGAASRPLTVRFEQFQGLTLTVALRPAPPILGARLTQRFEDLPMRDYRLDRASEEPSVIRSVGHVEREEGLYLFVPAGERNTLLRMFAPRSAYTGFVSGETPLEKASRSWISTQEELLLALERQKNAAAMPLGEALLDLGMVTREELDQALLLLTAEKPLGAFLVDAAVLTQADLQTAMAHKMHMPKVDLLRFPIDPVASAKIPIAAARDANVVPLLIHDRQLVLAVESPSRMAEFAELRVFAGMPLLPVISPASHIQAVFARQVEAGSVNRPPAGSGSQVFAATS